MGILIAGKSSLELDIFSKHEGELIHKITESNITVPAQHALVLGLINEATCRELLLQPSRFAVTFVSEVKNRISQNPAAFHALLEVLRRQGNDFATVANQLEKSYTKCYKPALGTSTPL